MKLTNPKIEIINNVGQIRTRSFNPTNGIATANTAYKEGAMALAEMFREALKTGDIKRVVELSAATETKSFYEY